MHNTKKCHIVVLKGHLTPLGHCKLEAGHIHHMTTDHTCSFLWPRVPKACDILNLMSHHLIPRALETSLLDVVNMWLGMSAHTIGKMHYISDLAIALVKDVGYWWHVARPCQQYRNLEHAVQKKSTHGNVFHMMQVLRVFKSLEMQKALFTLERHMHRQGNTFL